MFTVREILKVIKGAKIQGTGAGTGFTHISIDSRTVQAGDLFIPIKGAKFDGKDFIQDALKKGAAVLEVKDGLKALQALAAYHRSKFKIPVIGITGSVGKTTTKDMLASILSQEMKVLKNEENFNNEIGVPLTLLKLTKKHKVAVIEMAMQALGEIELLARIARPTIAIVTNIGESHLEFLKSKKNIARAKAEIFTHLNKKDHAVINADDEYFEHLMSNVKCPMNNVVTFGILEKATITPKDLRGIELPLPGEHMIYDALAAIAAAKILKVKKASIKKGLELFHPSSNRWEVINRPDKVKIINDTYNANPQSMAAALKTLACLEGRKIAVLGDMFELGPRAEEAHKRIGRLARELKIDKLVAIGKLSKYMRGDYRFAHPGPAVKKIKDLIRPGDRVLVKASRGMHLEEVVEALRRI